MFCKTGNSVIAIEMSDCMNAHRISKSVFRNLSLFFFFILFINTYFNNLEFICILFCIFHFNTFIVQLNAYCFNAQKTIFNEIFSHFLSVHLNPKQNQQLESVERNKILWNRNFIRFFS